MCNPRFVKSRTMHYITRRVSRTYRVVVILSPFSKLHRRLRPHTDPFECNHPVCTPFVLPTDDADMQSRSRLRRLV